MIKTPLSTMVGGAFWTPSATILGGTSKTFDSIIKSLFANGEQGFVYDPNDLTTMFQDAAGTIPVTGAGQAVGLIRDKSGRNNHARQTTSASRPILRQNATTGAYYLAFDGTDDFLVTSSINFTATDKISLFAGVRKLGTTTGLIAEFSAISDNKGTFGLRAPNGSKSNYGVSLTGSTELSANTAEVFQAPSSNVLTALFDISQTVNSNEMKLLVNATQYILQDYYPSEGNSAGTGNLGNFPLYIGRRGGSAQPFSGHIYSLIGVGRLTTDDETKALEKLIAKNTGVTLSV